MKKTLYSILALALILPAITSAATFSFSPNTGSFAPGKTFSVSVFVNPGVGEEITVAKLSSVFSVSGLEVVSFSQSSGWMPLSTPDSDLIDNTAGKLIKTAGLPARVTASKLFGTITLKAKNAGVATLSIKGDSMMLDNTNANKFTTPAGETAGASFTIVAPVVKPAKTTPSKKTSNTSSVGVKITEPIAPSSDTEGDTAGANDATTTENIATPSQVAAVATAGDNANSKNIWYYLIAVLAILAGVFAWREWRK